MNKRAFLKKLGLAQAVITTNDGSTTIGGNPMNSGVTGPFFRYALEAGQIVIFTTVPTTSPVIVQQ